MNENQITEAYRARLIDGLYNKNISNRDLLYAKIHQQLEVTTEIDPESLDESFRELAITNQKLYLIDKMFGSTEKDSEVSPQETD